MIDPIGDLEWALFNQELLDAIREDAFATRDLVRRQEVALERLRSEVSAMRSLLEPRAVA